VSVGVLLPNPSNVLHPSTLYGAVYNITPTISHHFPSLSHFISSFLSSQLWHQIQFPFWELPVPCEDLAFFTEEKQVVGGNVFVVFMMEIRRLASPWVVHWEGAVVKDKGRATRDVQAGVFVL